MILGLVALFHAHGLGNALLASVRSGAALVLLPAFRRDETLAAIECERVTIFPTVPFVAQTLAETRRAAAVDTGSLRLCFTAGAPLARETFVPGASGSAPRCASCTGAARPGPSPSTSTTTPTPPPPPSAAR